MTLLEFDEPLFIPASFLIDSYLRLTAVKIFVCLLQIALHQVSNLGPLNDISKDILATLSCAQVVSRLLKRFKTFSLKILDLFPV
jgi:hypothetical protein